MTKFIFSILVLSCSMKAIAQVKVQVITKTIERSFEYQSGDVIRLQGEKSNMTILSWDKQEVKVQIKLIAKARDKSLAEKELEYQKYICEKRKNSINLKNYFLVPKGQQLNVILQAEYHVSIPSNASVFLDNNYGNVSLDQTGSNSKIDFRYGTLDIKELTGNSEIKGYFGDLVISKLSGKGNIDVKHTKSVIRNIGGNIKMKTSLGDVLVGALDEDASLIIEASKSDVDLHEYLPGSHFLKLRSEYGEILIPSDFPGKVDFVSEDLNTLEQGDESKNSINIKTTFGNIIMELR